MITSEKKVEIWDMAYKSPKTVREMLLDVYKLGKADAKHEMKNGEKENGQMTNRERYAEDILDIVCTGKNIAMRNGELLPCDGNIRCSECDFYSGELQDCAKIEEWANAEYKEKN